MRAEGTKIVVKTIKEKKLLEYTEGLDTLTGIVEAIGPNYPGLAVVGETVVYSSISGRRSKIKDEEFLTLNPEEILMILDEDER